jgi:hypothetical protein
MNDHVDEQLKFLFEECSQPGWEGECSVAVERETLLIVKDPIESLPENANHSNRFGFPEKKEDQQSLALKLSAKATKRIPPRE